MITDHLTQNQIRRLALAPIGSRADMESSMRRINLRDRAAKVRENLRRAGVHIGDGLDSIGA